MHTQAKQPVTARHGLPAWRRALILAMLLPALSIAAPEGLSDTEWTAILEQIEMDLANEFPEYHLLQGDEHPHHKQSEATPRAIPDSISPYVRLDTLVPQLDGDSDTFDVRVRFGHSVAIDGDRLIVGVPDRVGSAGNVRGAAFIYQRTSGVNWEQTQRMLFGSGGDARCGHSVALGAGFAVIGCPDFTSGGLSRRGRVLIYQLVGGQYTDPTTFLGSSTNSQCGHAVDIIANNNSGNTTAYAASSCLGDGAPSSSPPGAVEVYRYRFTGLPPVASWTSDETIASPLTSLMTPLEFGYSVSLYQSQNGGLSRLAIGQPRGADDSGRVYVYTRDTAASANWEQEFVSTRPGSSASGARFGHSVSIWGTQLAVGSPGSLSDRGRVYTFNNGLAGWSSSQTVEPDLFSGGASMARFGHAVAHTGNQLWVGQPYWRNENDNVRGRVWRYRVGCTGFFCTPQSSLEQTFIDESSLSLNNGEYGYALAADRSAGVVAVGSPRAGTQLPLPQIRWGRTSILGEDRIFANGFR